MGGGDEQDQPCDEHDLRFDDHSGLFGPAVSDPCVIHLGVAAAKSDKFIVCPQFHNFAGINDGDSVGTASRCETMGDDDSRSSFENHVECLLDA